MKFKVLTKKHLKRKIRVAYGEGYLAGQEENFEKLSNDFKKALKEKENELAAILFSLARDRHILELEDNGIATQQIPVPTQLSGSYMLAKITDPTTDTIKYRAAYVPPRG